MNEEVETKINKLCTICNQEKVLEQFSRLRTGKYGRSSQCKECRNQQRKHLKYIRAHDNQVIYCSRCQRNLTADNFYTDKSSSNGLQTYCKQCQKTITEHYNATFDGYMSALYLNLMKDAKKNKVEVNLTKEDLYNLYDKQNKLCSVTKFIMTANNKQERGKKSSLRNISIDRINHDKGYIIDNIQLICYGVTLLKLKFTPDELRTFCLAIINNYQ